MNTAMRRQMVLRVNTFKPPTVVGGKRSAPVAYLTDLPASRIDPLEPELVARYPTNGPVVIVQCYVFGDYDIVKGHLIAEAGTSHKYTIRDVETWTHTDGTLYRLILEDLT